MQGWISALASWPSRDIDDLAIDKTGFIRSEEKDRIGELIQAPQAVQDDGLRSNARCSATSSGVRVELVIGVRNVPGATQLTLMPCGPSSRASVFVN